MAENNDDQTPGVTAQDFEYGELNPVTSPIAPDPMYNPHTSGYYNTERQLQKDHFTVDAFENRNTFRAIVLRVENPGGEEASSDPSLWTRGVSEFKKLAGIETAPTTGLQVLKVMVPELHPAPNPGLLAADDTEGVHQGRINNFYPTVIAESNLTPRAQPGDVVYIEFTDADYTRGVYIAPVIGNPVDTTQFAGVGGVAAFGNTPKLPPADTVPCGESYHTLIEKESQRLKIEPATALAVFQAESGGRTFCPNGRPLVRFEPHTFVKVVKKEHGIEKARQIPWYPCGNTKCKNWLRTYRHGGGCNRNWDIEWGINMAAAFSWARANGVDDEMVYRAASYGAGQILGVNYSIRYSSAKELFEKNAESEAEQILTFFAFVEKNALGFARRKDWYGFSGRYNGGGVSGQQKKCEERAEEGKSCHPKNMRRFYARYRNKSNWPPDRQLVCAKSPEPKVASTPTPAGTSGGRSSGAS